MYYAVFGRGVPVLLIHNGLGSADDWGAVVPTLARRFEVIVADTRGFGRSTRTEQPYTYELLASDYVGLLDALGIGRTFVAGTSDGAIIGLELAVRAPDRVLGVFAQGANISEDGIEPRPKDLSAIRLALARARTEYTRLSATPSAYADFRKAVDAMPAPAISEAQLRSVRVPVVIAVADHEESIRPEHSEHIAALIPGARLLVLRNVSHFAPLQDGPQFAAAVEAFVLRVLRRSGAEK